jgi:hypothetical protein
MYLSVVSWYAGVTLSITIALCTTNAFLVVGLYCFLVITHRRKNSLLPRYFRLLYLKNFRLNIHRISQRLFWHAKDFFLNLCKQLEFNTIHCNYFSIFSDKKLSLSVWLSGCCNCKPHVQTYIHYLAKANAHVAIYS